MVRRRAGIAIGALLLAVIVAAMVSAWWLARSGLPRRDGQALIAGLQAPVDVRWNDWGVPHLNAESPVDLARAVGYLHANDRFAQMELGRRLVSGRLAEVVGDVALPSDRYFVSLDMRRLAVAGEAGLGDETRSLLEGYAQGVNAWLAERGSGLPPEIRLLGIDPAPWSVRDSLYFQLHMAHQLSFWQGRPEEARFRWLAAIGADRLADLLGTPLLQVAPEILELAAATDPGSAADKEPSETVAMASPGSNNWVLGPSRTAAGSAIVANDPHLPLAVPGFWYQVLLRAPGYEVAGMTLPGLPFVVIGRGPHLAWALTNLMLDDHDLFFEQLDASGERVRRGDRWLPLQIHSESVHHRDGGSETVLVRQSDLGVVLDADPGRDLPARSMAWTAAIESDPGTVFLRLARGRRVASLVGTLDAYVAPAQNLVAADTGGGILHTPIGRIPDRRTADGRMPAPGWNPLYGWDGLLPHAANPSRLDPESDLLVTANHDILGAALDAPPSPLTADFDTPHRAERIRALLLERRDWDAAGMAEVQTDVRSRYALEIVAMLDGPHAGDAGRALAALQSWDGAMLLTGPSALFVVLERELMQGAFADEARHHDLPGPGGRGELLRLLAGTLDPAWWDDVSTPARETREGVIAGALERAWEEVTERWGDDPGRWEYGALHNLLLQHPLGALPILGGQWNIGPLPVPGSATTVAAFAGFWVGERQDVVYGPSMRWVTDLGDPDGTLTVLPTGQSGHPGDRHYADQLPLYLQGQLRLAHWSEAAIEANTVSRMRLLPTPVR